MIIGSVIEDGYMNNRDCGFCMVLKLSNVLGKFCEHFVSIFERRLSFDINLGFNTFSLIHITYLFEIKCRSLYHIMCVCISQGLFVHFFSLK